MIRRPMPVNVISCILIATGVLPLFVSAFNLVQSGSPANVGESGVAVFIQYAMSFAATVAELVSGYFMLKGKNWARWLCIGWSIAGLLFSLVTSTMKWMLLPGAIYVAVIAYFLFRRDANEFFVADRLGKPVQGMPSVRSVFSACAYLGSGLALSTASMMAFYSYPQQLAMAKLFLLGVVVLPGAVLLGVGRLLSEDPNWKCEVGTILTASAMCGAMVSLTITLMFSDLTYGEGNSTGDLDFSRDYLSGGLWIAGMFLLGILLVRAGNQESRTPPVHASIPGFKRR